LIEEVPWLPRAPDLNPLDFFSGVIRKILFTRILRSDRLNMMNRIKRVCEGIIPEILRSILENFESRL